MAFRRFNGIICLFVFIAFSVNADEALFEANDAVIKRIEEIVNKSKSSFISDEEMQELSKLNKKKIDPFYIMAYRYEHSDLTQYKNFDDYYMTMHWFSYPNIPSGLNDEFNLAVDQLDFSNPQALKAYRKLREVEDQRIRQLYDQDSSYFQKKSSAYSNRTEVEKNEDAALSLASKRAYMKFAKQGYYRYFKQLLEQQNLAYVPVCVNADGIYLGIFRMGNEYLESREKAQRLEQEIDFFIESLDKKMYSSVEYQLQATRVNCDVLLTLNADGLDRLYQEPRVASFINPKHATPIYFKNN